MIKIRDLGEMDGPVLAFGGPYSNLQATQALITEAQKRDIPAYNTICTGDVVAYCGQPAETIAALRGLGGPIVAGNMEQQLGAEQTDCGCGFEEGTACDIMADTWFAHVDKAMTPQTRAWMADLPDWITFTQFGKRVAVLHGSASDVAQFLWPVTETAVFEMEWRIVEHAIGPVDIVLSGHSGIPFIKNFAFGTWINAGVIGMPPHDGAPQTRFAILSKNGPVLHDLPYEAEVASKVMRDAGLVQGYHEALLTGYWPSEDVLPLTLRRAYSLSGDLAKG